MLVHKKWLVIATVLFAFAQLTLSGCLDRVKNFAPEDFKKVTKGMAEDKVKDLLGSPIEKLEDPDTKQLVFTWKSGDQYCLSTFRDGKVEATRGPISQREFVEYKAYLDARKKIPR